MIPDALLLHHRRLEERVGLLTDGAGRIVALAAEADLAPKDWERFPGETWCAAPVLAHAHLEDWDAPAPRLPRTPFADWVAALLAWRGTAERLAPEASAAAALRELSAGGCGLVAAHVGAAGAEGGPDAVPEALAWREVLDPFPAETPEAAAERWQAAAAPCAGLALHAPYTVPADLARAVFRRAQGLVSVHLGETPEERACLADGTGPLAELLQTRRGRALRERHHSPLAWLAAAGGLRAGTLAVHCGDLDAGELRGLEAAAVAIVFCPGTHQWFGRPQPAFAAAGVLPRALGCDSRAANPALDPLRELRLACAMLPERDAAHWWRALTEGGAEALGRADLGRLEPGRSLRPLRLADPRARAAWAAERGPERRAAGLCAWLAQTPDPERRGATIPRLEHA